jgi:negative regulator of sigma E activity
MNDRDPLLDQRLQALLDDRLGDRRDAGLRSATLDPETRRALGAYKAVYRALREEPPSTLPDGFAARVAAAAGYAPARGEVLAPEREWAPWQVAVAAGAAVLGLSAISVAAIAEEPGRLLAAFDGPLGPLTVALFAAVVFDQLLAARRAAHG